MTDKVTESKNHRVEESKRRGVDRFVPSLFYDRVFVPAREELRQAWAERSGTEGGGWSLLSAVRYGIALTLLMLHCCRLSCTAWIEARAWRVIHPLSDVKYAVRLLIRQPAFTAVSVAALALGIGASTAIFTVVDGVLLKPLPYSSPGELVQVAEKSVRLGVPMSVAPLNFLDWRDENRSLERLAAYDSLPITLTNRGESERITVYRASAELFDILRVKPILGRTFTAAEDREHGAPVVILSHALWRRRFGAAPAVLGTMVRFDGVPREIVGVMPQGLEFPADAEAWFPLALDASETAPTDRGAHYLSVVARLKPGVTMVQADGDLQAIAARLSTRYPRTNAGTSALVRPLVMSMVESTRPALVTLLASVGFLMLIACANVSNLLLARASSRRAEMAMRTAFGASRLRLLIQLLTESVVLASVGGALGIVVAAWGVDALLAMLPDDLPRLRDIVVDVRVLTFALGISALASLTFGLAPAIHIVRSDHGGALKVGHRGAGASRGRKLRDLMVGTEMALALVLLVTSVLSFRSFDRLSRVEPGFDPSGVLTFQIALPTSRYPSPDDVASFVERFVADLSSLPGVRSGGGVMILPLKDERFGGSFRVVGTPEPDEENEPNAQVRAVTPGYFRTLGIPVIRGRDVTDRDRGTSTPVAIVSESTARQYWPDGDALGRKLKLHVGVTEGRQPEREIVGIVRDVKQRRLELPSSPVIYVPHTQYQADTMSIVLKTAVEPTAMLGTVTARLKAFDQEMAVAETRTLDSYVALALAAFRFRAVLFGLFAATALILAAIGLYGVVSYSVSQRTQEIGVRMALGAAARDVLTLVVRQGFMPVVAGLAVGLAGAAAMARLMSSLLFEVSPLDPATYLTVSLVLGAVGLVACYLPARRATRTDPLEALRSE